jgi:hypothetical protein
MLNEVKHLAIAREILRGVYPRAKRRAQNDIVHHLTCDKALVKLLTGLVFLTGFTGILFFVRFDLGNRFLS